jgi:hypothetical protein
LNKPHKIKKMKQSTGKKKTIGTVLGLLAGLVILFTGIQSCTSPTFDKVLMQTASELNKTCPVMVDKETRLDNAVALPENVFQYNYTLINVVKDSVNIQAFEDIMKPMILNIVKTNPDLKIFRDNKVTMSYNYQDMNGVFITKISVVADQYAE